jgi:hypothetical protein
MNNMKLTTDNALKHLVNLIRRLFDDRIPLMKETQVKRRFEKELFTALQKLADDPSSNLEEYPTWVERLTYEMLTQYVMFYGLQPDVHLSINVKSAMTEDDILKALLTEEIIPNSWPYPQSVPF